MRQETNKKEIKKETKKEFKKPIRWSDTEKPEGKKEIKWSDSKKPEGKRSDFKKQEGKKPFTKKNGNAGKNKKNDGVCPFEKKCGSCQYQGMAYEEQLAIKQNKLKSLLGEFGRLDRIIGMENPYHYRNKIHSTFQRKKDGSIISGVYEEGSHRLVPIENCMIEDKRADAIIKDIRDLLKSFKIKTFNEDSGFGLFRHVLIRTGYHSGEIMVVLVVASPVFPGKNNFVKALRKLHPEITTICMNINDKKTSMILGDRMDTLYGKGYITDTLCGKQFRISPKSFYQVNPTQTEVLYNKAIEFAGLTGKETILDAYCGIGTIGLIASDHAEKVISVELNKDAVRDAITNAKINNVSNTRFFNNDAGKFMVGMAQTDETVDVVFMDPPRAGSDENFLSSVTLLAPKKIVYISCNPITLQRDLDYLVEEGYDVKKIQGVDMFPWTSHVECVTLLQRKDA